MDLQELTQRVLDGYMPDKADALALAEYEDLDALCDAAHRIACKFTERVVDSCSIVNARSGLCGEDCKWCAQASRHKTGCATYNAIDEEEVMHHAHTNQKAGIKRFSLVTAGKRVNDRDMPHFLDIYRRLGRETNLYLCASMGLISEEQLKALRESGVKRYHCNLETSERFFPRLCSSHTSQEKKETIRAAKRAGMAICSGGIIGMGETMEDRIDLALELRELDVDSVPINVLNPIKGTPLEDTPLISEEDVARTVAVFRFLLPAKTLRFAGGRARLSRATMKRILQGGMNGALMGDLLTSVGNSVEEDKQLFEESGIGY